MIENPYRLWRALLDKTSGHLDEFPYRRGFTRCFDRNLRFWIVFVCMVLGIGTPGVVRADTLDEEIRVLEGFTKTYHLIQSQYVESRTARELIRFAIEGMVNRLDPYSEAIDKEELEELESNSTGTYVGIGISIQKDKGLHVVTQVIQGSPSEKAGLKPGDILIQLNDIKLRDQRESDLSRMVGGAVGTQLVVLFYHPEAPDAVIERSIERVMVSAPSVIHFETEPSTVVIQIQQFQKATPEEVAEVLAQKQYAAVILDLRNNPGGLFLAAVETAELFIDGGDIVETRDRRNRLIERYVSRKTHQGKSPLLVVMMNRYSASSAEIVAGAIKDRKVGLIVGEKSYGKGVVQTVFPLGEDLYVKLTTARYFTPSGVSFHGVGVKPDHSVADTIGINRYGQDDQIYSTSLDLIRSSGVTR